MKLLVIPLTKRKSEPTHYKANFSNGWHLSVPDNCPDIYTMDLHKIGKLATVIVCNELVNKIKEIEANEES